MEAGWIWREIRRGRQVITEAVFSRDEETLASSLDACQMEESGTLREASRFDILEEMLKDL